MGVKGLWRLLLPIGRRISLETLHGKVLAVDASIWLTQFLKAMRNPETGRVQASAHLIGFFRRLCRLHFHGIRPVFVFDGATPEIKKRELAQRRRRRERFESLGGDAAVQRMARRLLAETLRKQKKSKGGKNAASVEVISNTHNRRNAAYAPGFNPGDEVSVSESKGDEDVDEASSSSKNEGTTSELQSGQPSVDSLKVDQMADRNEEETNDWDRPLVAEQNSEVAEAESKNASESDSEIEYEDFGLKQNVQRTMDDFAMEDEEAIVRNISNLPSSERKDAIERAKRKQRLRSRKEFMPAAANPQSFSEVQLTNFLRSTKLNKSIIKMATEAAKIDNHGLRGEAMASDRRTRVELIREDDEIKPTNSPSRIKRINISKRNGTSHKTEDEEASSDESWMHELAENKNEKEDRIDIQDRKPAARRVLALEDSDDSNSVEGGGFLPASSECRVQNSSFHRLSSFPYAGGSRDEEIVKCQADQGEGFVAKDSERAATGSPRKPDSTLAQELEDRTLAEALQREEDEAEALTDSRIAVSAEFLHKAFSDDFATEETEELSRNETRTLRSGGETNAIDVDGESDVGESLVWENGGRLAGTDQTDEPAGGRGNEEGKSDNDSVSIDDDIDWEDGTPVDGLNEAVPLMKNCYTGEMNRSGVADMSEDARSDQPRIPEDRKHRLKMDAGDKKSDPDVSKEMDADSSYDSKAEIESLQKPEVGAVDCGVDDYADTEWKTCSEENETTAALERAQATASNLADWAGRVFKRVMKEANVESRSTVDPARSHLPTESQCRSSPQKHGPKSENSRESFSPVASKPLFSEKHMKSVQKDPNSCIGPQGSTAVFEYRPTEFDPVLLEAEEATWTAERNQRERDADTVTDEMRLEVIQLLRLFGVPYVEAPAEAEAQCVALEQLGLVDGIVTEDSDVFVFGGRTIYKHIFDEMKYVEVYLASDAEKEMGLGRNQMVALAMLLGGDYTEGVKGVGIVNSMELLQAFDVSEDLRKGLLNFRKWLDGFDPMECLQATNSDPEGSAEELAFHRKHRTARSRWAAPDSFPSEQVMKAYVSPVVDKSGDTFSWGSPDVESLCRFCGRTIGWSSEETLQMLEPVINNASSGLRQTRIDSFMKYEDSIKFADVRSKRLRDVLGLKSDTQASTQGKKKKS